MDWGSPIFVIAIIAISTGGWLINNWIRARHGYSLENEWGGMTERTDDAGSRELTRENHALRSELKTVHDRVAVLERIVTDKGYTLAEEIEALRGPTATDAGVPLSAFSKERV